MIAGKKSHLLLQYYDIHRAALNLKILQIALIYLSLSIVWNTVFNIFNLQLSRADIPTLVVASGVTTLVYVLNRLVKSSRMMQHVVMLLVLFIIGCLYIGSGYREAWGFFLFMPLISGIYGEMLILLVYSVIGLTSMLYFSMTFPLIPDTYDSIDISNRVLLYVIVATFSRLLLLQLSKQYQDQVNTINQSMESTVEQVVNSFVISIEAKDSYTFGHSERVSQYAVALASRLPEYDDAKKLKSLRLAGLLHDVGKINIPEAVLTKPDKLSEAEFELIKTHPIVGARMVEKISGLGSLKPGVLYHHERWDGGGYPTGLKEEEIPMDARLLAIADAFDAMTSNRSYRSALSFNEAMERLIMGSAYQFDPNLIDLLGKIELSWLRIHEESNDEFEEFEKLTNFL